MSSTRRRPVYFNSTSSQSLGNAPSDAVLKFHQNLPHYHQTPLISLDALTKELGIKAVYIKDESHRLHLSSFKILGASWGTFRAIAAKTGLPVDTTLDTLSDAAIKQSITLYAATDGNHGRAVAYMAKLLRIKAEIFVPGSLDDAARARISSEGANVTAVYDSYDAAVEAASVAAASEPSGLLIQDTAFEGYEEIPAWITEGYATMVREIDLQLEEKNIEATMVITPVGVGSLAQAVVSHYKSAGRQTPVVSVEPDTAACLYKNLRSGKCLPLKTFHTIMNGLDCGTVSSTAWPILRAGVDASVTISDFESHQAVQYLASQGVNSGPCGAASVAALRRIAQKKPLDPDTVVVLLSTEGPRPYPEPHDVSCEDPAALADLLESIAASSPAINTSRTALKTYIAAWLEHRDLGTGQLNDYVYGNASLTDVAASMVSLLHSKA
ncbi:hypothetical protein FQN55_007237 [Onygenales sp. PD_40]|nr:hypothetical protein FQN55_007237 [Onygenales sp. PD_40]